MKHPTEWRRAGRSRVLADAEFTLDMLRNLFVVFEATSDNQPILVEMSDRAVWAVTPEGQRMFIGDTRNPPAPRDA